MTVGHKIRMLREEKNISQAELGEILNKSQGSIAKYEGDTSEMDYNTMVALCDYANWSLDYLLGRVDSPELEIRIAPENDEGATEYTIKRDAPDLTVEDIKFIKQFIKDSKQGNNKKD